MSMAQLVLLISLILLHLALSGTPKKALHSSCFDLEDGTHYLQILSNEELSLFSQSEEDYYLTAPIVHVKCHNGYTIIDPSFDDSWISYFSSYHKWKLEFSGPDLDDHVNWSQWFLPSNNINEISYAISPDCKQCIVNDDEQYANKVYYMSGDIFACYWPINSMNTNNFDQCTSDSDSNEYSQCSKCYANDHDMQDKMYYSSNCASMIYDANTPIFSDHSHCFEDNSPNRLPSIGTNGEYCVCYKPSSQTPIKPANWGDHYAIDSWDDYNNNNDAKFDTDKEEELQQLQSNENNNNINNQAAVNIELYQTDFEQGTYRIFKSGTYVLQEDIKFNFNPGGTKHPNSYDAWMPSEDDEYKYPGASSNNKDDYYSMGFFAGITIETDDVIIDLNGHSLQMDTLFYLQQRFFICISLTNKVFTDGNGITFMGIGQQSANNVIIKNGIIGLTSHIGIYGIHNKNINLLNIHVRDFETHGIVMDEFKRFSIKNVEIGPSVNGQLKVNTRYTNARLMLPIFYNVAKENKDETVYFNNNNNILMDEYENENENENENNNMRGPYTMSDIIDRLRIQMDLAFEYAVNGLDNIDSDSVQWKQAKQLFVIEDGVSEYTTMYGLVLRPKKDAQYAEEYSTDNIIDIDSQVAEIEDLYIHDLIINPKQVIKIGVSDSLWLRNSFNAPIDLSVAIQKSENENQLDNNINDAIYFGDVYTDALMAVRQLSNSWWSLGRMIIWDEFIQWTQSNQPLETFYTTNDEDEDEEIKEICGYDIVTGLSKGIIGIHIAYSHDISMKNIVIENLINMGSLQHSNCDLKNNYEGNHARAISIFNGKNINIEQLSVNKIVSFNGPSYGIYNDNNEGLKYKRKKNKRHLMDIDLMTDEIHENELNDHDAIITLNYAQFSHIDAGIKGTYDRIDISKDIGFNSAAQTCSIYCAQHTGVFGENIKNYCNNYIQYYGMEETCMNGHILCSHEFQQMMIHHECQTDADYETPIGTIYVNKYGQINAEFITDKYNSNDFNNKNSNTSIIFHGEYFAVAIIVILAILAAIKCIYFKSTNDKQQKKETIQNENSPLLSDNDQIDYDNL